jgi:hypothetical protein
MSNGMGYDAGEGGWEGNRGGYGYGRRGRGRGRGGRGPYRGGRGGYYNDNYGGTELVNEYGGYDDGDLDAPPQPPQGRGKASTIKPLNLFIIFISRRARINLMLDVIWVLGLPFLVWV